MAAFEPLEFLPISGQWQPSALSCSPLLLALRPPADNDRDPLYMQSVLTDLLGSMNASQSFSLLYATVDGEAQLLAELPSGLVTTMEKFLHAKYPDVESVRVSSIAIPNPEYLWSQSLRLSPDIQPILLADAFQDKQVRNFADPVAALLQAVETTDGIRGLIRIQVRPAKTRHRRRARSILQRLSHPFWKTHTALADVYADFANASWWKRWLVFPVAFFLKRHPVPADLQNCQQKLAQALVHAQFEVQAWSDISNRSTETQIRKRLRVLGSSLDQFVEAGRVAFVTGKPRREASRVGRSPRSLLSVSELASLWHVPTEAVKTPTLARPSYRQLPPPVGSEKGSRGSSGLQIGRVDFQNDRRPVRIADADRMHTLIAGKSGCGKSALMQSMVTSDAARGAGIGVVDPHGDLIDDILASSIPKQRTNEVVLFDVADRAEPMTYNPLACSDSSQRPLVASSLLSALKKVFGFDETSAPRLINILRYTLLALLETDHATLLDVSRVLKDKTFRNHIASQLEDAEVKSFWLDEVAGWTARYEAESMPAILNKLGQFTANPITRAILSDPVGSLNIRTVMDRQQMLLVNLSQGLVGEDAATLLGSLLVAGIQQAAMSRADVDKAERRPFYLYVDEYPVYVNDSFATILAQARKYGLFLTSAQQLTQQCSETLMANMFGNVSTVICFQVAFDDAQIFADQLGEPIQPADLLHLPRYRCAVRTSINGIPTRPFTIATLPPATATRRTAIAETVRRVSRRRFGRPVSKRAGSSSR